MLLTLLLTFHQNTHANNLKIMLFGDSLMAGYGLDEKHHLNIQLYHDLLHHDIKTTIINASVSGDTSFNGLKRISWSLQDDPDYILLGLGANDMLRGIDPNTTLQNLEKIIQIIQEKKDIQTILLGMQSQEAYGEKFKKDFDEIYQKLSDKYNLLYYGFFLEGVALIPELNQSDGKHPNADGIKLISKKLSLFLKEILKK